MKLGCSQDLKSHNGKFQNSLTSTLEHRNGSASWEEIGSYIFSRSPLVTYLIILSPEKYIIVLESLKFWIRDSAQTLIVTTRSVSLSCPGTITFLHKWLIRCFVRPSGPLFKQRPSPSRAFFYLSDSTRLSRFTYHRNSFINGNSQLSLIRTHLGPVLCVRPPS